jgi:uncharacterized membrane-anchored protein
MSRFAVRGAIFAAWALIASSTFLIVKGHEQTLAQGDLILLELAPVDPRSLMQGDYMALRFAADDQLANGSVYIESSIKTSYAYFTLDAQGRGEFAAVGDAPSSEPDQISMRIRKINGRYSIGPNAFFFQEGTGGQLEAAKWGGFRVATDGSALLVSLHDAELQALGAQQR